MKVSTSAPAGEDKKQVRVSIRHHQVLFSTETTPCEVVPLGQYLGGFQISRCKVCGALYGEEPSLW
jgi:hypothetical protein